MSTSPLRRRALSVALAAVAIVSAAGPASAAPAADRAATTKAAAWLAGELTDAGTVVGSFPGTDGQPDVYTDWGRTLDAALALLAAGGHDDVLGVTLTSVSTPTAVIEYTQGAPFDRAGAAYAGATAKLAFVIEATGGDATDVGGVDLLAQLLSLITPEGRLKDRSDFGDYANLFGHAFALLALDTAGRTPSQTFVQGLLSAQCPDGSFPEGYVPAQGKACTGSVDATGLVLQALAAVGLGTSDAANRASTWLQGQQRSDGSFPGEAPVNSTGYAVLGLNAVGVDTSRAVAYLGSQQQPNGGLRRGATTPDYSDVFATAQALPALAGMTFQSSARNVARRPIPCASAIVTLPRTAITATQPAVVQIRATSGTVVDLYGYSRPSTQYAVVRTVTVGSEGLASLTVRPATNTRLYAQQRGCARGADTVLNVRTALTLAVARNGARTYTFSGSALPARPGGLIVSLYRGTVLAAQTRADATTGMWSLRRTFGGSGRFDFVVRTGQDMQNAPGRSNTRSLLVY